jgi:Ca-activated chloride channel family protein
LRSSAITALLSIGLALAVAGGPARAQEAEDAATADDEARVTVALPADEAAEARVVAGGVARSFRVVEPSPWQVAIYFDQLLSDPRVLRNGTVLLSERAEALAALGPVEILLGGATVRSALPPTRDVTAISDALAWLRIRESSADAQGELRRDFATAWAEDEVDGAALAELAAESVARESELIRLQQEGLLLWATGERNSDRRLLVLVGSGFDTDPTAFYRELLRQSGHSEVEVPQAVVDPTAAEVAQALALSGWTVLAYAPGERGDALLAGPSAQVPPSTVATPDGREIERGVASFNALKLRGRGKKEGDPGTELELRLNPRSALEPFVQATAGALITDGAVLDGFLGELHWRAQLAVEMPSVSEPLALAVTAGAGGREVGAPIWMGRGAPAVLSSARARFLASSGESADGELQVAALVSAGDPPRLAVELSSAGGGRDLTPPLRLTVGQAREQGTVILDQREIGLAEVGRGRIDLALPAGLDPGAPLVVVIDELSSLRWGGTFAGYSGQAAPVDLGDGSIVLDLPSAAVVRLLAPQDPLLVGRVRFAAAVADPAVRRVDFLLDGNQESVRRSAPFEAELDLGELPRQRRVEAVARDAAGVELGRDVLLVNSGNSELSLRLTAPGAEASPGGSVKAARELTVEAEVAVPRGSRVARVDFYWLDRLIGTLYSPPYRQRVMLPGESARGFVRAVVSLVEGSVAEEVLFVNAAGSSAQVQVTLVEVLAVVTDSSGRPVADLDQDVFTIKEEGDAKEIAVFNGAEDMPLTVGMAVDSSASMFIKLPQVQVAAMDFLRDLVSERDRAFVVGFGSEPQLLAPTTGDVSRLIEGVNGMSPDGFTSIWKGIVYSLVQLQGAPGKKALIVYSDGADEDPDFSYRTARRFARVVGVPIYVILSNNEIVRTAGKGLNIRGFLGRLEDLVTDVGGKVYFTRVGADLATVYAQIAEELRSQYVLGYYGQQDESTGWRKIEVDVSIPGLDVRSARGRYPD